MELDTMLHTVQMASPDDRPDGKIRGANVGLPAAARTQVGLMLATSIMLL